MRMTPPKGVAFAHRWLAVDLQRAYPEATVAYRKPWLFQRACCVQIQAEGRSVYIEMLTSRLFGVRIGDDPRTVSGRTVGEALLKARAGITAALDTIDCVARARADRRAWACRDMDLDDGDWTRVGGGDLRAALREFAMQWPGTPPLRSIVQVDGHGAFVVHVRDDGAEVEGAACGQLRDDAHGFEHRFCFRQRGHDGAHCDRAGTSWPRCYP